MCFWGEMVSGWVIVGVGELIFGWDEFGVVGCSEVLNCKLFE